MAMSVNVKTVQSEIAAGSPFDSRVRPICKLCFPVRLVCLHSLPSGRSGRSAAVIEKHLQLTCLTIADARSSRGGEFSCYVTRNDCLGQMCFIQDPGQGI